MIIRKIYFIFASEIVHEASSPTRARLLFLVLYVALSAHKYVHVHMHIHWSKNMTEISNS